MSVFPPASGLACTGDLDRRGDRNHPCHPDGLLARPRRLRTAIEEQIRNGYSSTAEQAWINTRDRAVLTWTGGQHARATDGTGADAYPPTHANQTTNEAPALTAAFGAYLIAGRTYLKGCPTNLRPGTATSPTPVIASRSSPRACSTEQDERLLKRETASRLITVWELGVQREMLSALREVQTGGSIRFEVPHPHPDKGMLATITLDVAPVREQTFEADEIVLDITPRLATPALTWPGNSGLDC